MITRFAPSPTGRLHLGHAFSALTAANLAQEAGGTFLVRFDDIDQSRSRTEYADAARADLEWLGLSWPKPELFQSTSAPKVRQALEILTQKGLLYPCDCSRSDIAAAASAPQEGAPVHGPDGIVYPGTCRGKQIKDAGPDDALRLDMRRAIQALPHLPSFTETGPEHRGQHALTAEALIQEVGDVIVSRKSGGIAYHLSVVVDDRGQGITDVARGVDLFAATQIHVLLFALLDWPIPRFHHHRLIRDEAGKRLAKRDDARAIATYRNAGLSPSDVRDMLNM